MSYSKEELKYIKALISNEEFMKNLDIYLDIVYNREVRKLLITNEPREIYRLQGAIKLITNDLYRLRNLRDGKNA